MKPDFGAFLDELSDKLRRKSRQRGTKNISGPASVTNRMEDKLARLKRDPQGDDDWVDMAGYAGIGWLLNQGLWDDRDALQSVYLAHKTGETMAADFRSLFTTYGFAVFDPIAAFSNAKGHGEWVWNTNLAAIVHADLLFATLQGPSTGVGAEIVVAHLLGKEVWVHAPRDYESTTVVFAANRIFRSVEDVRIALREVQSARSDALPANPSATAAAEDDGLSTRKGL